MADIYSMTNPLIPEPVDYNIAFLALDDIHHIHHIAPIAFELSFTQGFQCVLYIQSKCLELTNKISKIYPGHSCQIKVVYPAFFRKILQYRRGGICSARGLIRQQERELLAFDGLVTPDLNLAGVIKKTGKKTGKRPLFFLTFHGGGSRPRSNQLLMDYNLVLLCGERRLKQFQQAGYLSVTDYAVTGYPKFDVIGDNRPALFANENPVILYNPHFEQALSSWRSWGLAVLEYFYRNPQYNLIFAPHCNLFRQYVSIKKIPRKYFAMPNMIIDIGSEKSVDMTYIQAADLYLGDVSSQVFEFIRYPRPCLFLNPNRLNKGDFFIWDLGAVVEDFAEFAAVLNQALGDSSYADKQKKYFAETFSLNAQPSARRAAQAIERKIREPEVKNV